jgi:ribose transport system ATP-binding protein
LQAYSGQIIGFGGVAGSGREEIGPLLGGEIARSSGTVRVRGRVIKNGSPVDSRRKGIGYLPGERAAKASIGQFSLTENLTLLDLSPFSSRLRINRKPELKETQSWLDVLEVRPRDPNREIRTLSGGNQQKVIMGRLLRVKPDVLVLNEPTQGVDVGAKAAIHELIREAAASGAVVLLCSSDTEELVSLSDEVVVLYRGRTAAVFSGSALTDTALDRAMLGELSRPESDEPSVSTGGRS